MIKEEWRPITKYEGLYEVSNFGCVRSLERVIKQQNYERKLKYGVSKASIQDLLERKTWKHI